MSITLVRFGEPNIVHCLAFELENYAWIFIMILGAFPAFIPGRPSLVFGPIRAQCVRLEAALILGMQPCAQVHVLVSAKWKQGAIFGVR